MGLSIIDMTTGKSVDNTRTYTFTGGTASSYTASGTTTIYPYHNFKTTSGYAVPLNASTSNTNCYYIVKSTSASASTSVTVGCSTTATKEYWSDVDISGIGYGKCATTKITSDRECVNFIGLFPYAGSVQTVSLPWYGTYKLECWGAQGGDAYQSATSIKARTGGRGGYATGNITMVKGTSLYVCVGAIGKTNSSSTTAAVDWSIGYNGGGALSTAGLGTTGGGATHIAMTTNRGELRNYVGNKGEVLIVAGAGGGASSWQSQQIIAGVTYAAYYIFNGGYGGGATGGTTRGLSSSQTYLMTFIGGSQTTPGNSELKNVNGKSNGAGGFGYGGKGQGNSHCAGSGGSGWYGGTGGFDDSAGAGGSSYVGNSALSGGSTIAGNATLTEPDGTSATGHTGAGYARIKSQ